MEVALQKGMVEAASGAARERWLAMQLSASSLVNIRCQGAGAFEAKEPENLVSFTMTMSGKQAEQPVDSSSLKMGSIQSSPRCFAPFRVHWIHNFCSAALFMAACSHLLPLLEWDSETCLLPGESDSDSNEERCWCMKALPFVGGKGGGISGHWSIWLSSTDKEALNADILRWRSRLVGVVRV